MPHPRTGAKNGPKPFWVGACFYHVCMRAESILQSTTLDTCGCKRNSSGLECFNKRSASAIICQTLESEKKVTPSLQSVFVLLKTPAGWKHTRWLGFHSFPQPHSRFTLSNTSSNCSSGMTASTLLLNVEATTAPQYVIIRRRLILCV